MKKYLVLLLMILNSGFIYALPVEIEIAKKVAMSFMGKKRASNVVKNVLTEKQNGQELFYIVNFLSGGWVIVSADDNTVPIFSYNLYGEFSFDDENP